MTTPTKVTKEALQAKIAAVDYVVMPDGRTTICQLTMQNGFTVRGESSCVSAENFNKALGEKYAYAKAFDAAWAFEGYLLAELLHREARGDENRHREEQEKARRDFVLRVLMATRVDNLDDAIFRIEAWRDAYQVGGSFGSAPDRLKEGRVMALREVHTIVGSFGWALDRMDEGARVARAGWNGKGMWLCVIKLGNAMCNGFDMQPCIGMKTADGKMQPGWVPSQQDMIAMDWVSDK